MSYYTPPTMGNIEASHLLSHSNQQQFFKKVGHFTLDDNHGSYFTARELKTVYLDCTCQYLKLSLQKSYHNEKNIFNQAAIVSLKISGVPLGIYESHALHGEEGYMATKVINDDPV